MQMVSGIGPKETLEKYGIAVLVDAPGVGQGMEVLVRARLVRDRMLMSKGPSRCWCNAQIERVELQHAQFTSEEYCRCGGLLEGRYRTFGEHRWRSGV